MGPILDELTKESKALKNSDLQRMLKCLTDGDQSSLILQLLLGETIDDSSNFSQLDFSPTGPLSLAKNDTSCKMQGNDILRRLRTKPEGKEGTAPLVFKLPDGIDANHALELDALMKKVANCSRVEMQQEKDDTSSYSCDFDINGTLDSVRFALDLKTVRQCC